MQMKELASDSRKFKSLKSLIRGVAACIGTKKCSWESLITIPFDEIVDIASL